MRAEIKKAIKMTLREIEKHSCPEDAECLSKTVATLYKLLLLPIIVVAGAAFGAACLYFLARFFV